MVPVYLTIRESSSTVLQTFVEPVQCESSVLCLRAEVRIIPSKNLVLIDASLQLRVGLGAIQLKGTVGRSYSDTVLLILVLSLKFFSGLFTFRCITGIPVNLACSVRLWS